MLPSAVLMPKVALTKQVVGCATGRRRNETFRQEQLRSNKAARLSAGGPFLPNIKSIIRFLYRLGRNAGKVPALAGTTVYIQ